MKTIDEASYEELVADILELREKPSYEKLIEFKKNERVVGLACHEWRYATGMLESAGIVTLDNDHDNRVIGTLTYGNVNKVTGRPNAVRSYTEDYICLRPEYAAYVDTLLAAYPYYAKPYPEEELTARFNSAIVVDMYSFYPKELLLELGMDTEQDKAIATMLNIANNINYYSHEETDTGENFENALTDAFNMFVDVDAERIGGSGNTDVECIYHPSDNDAKKFDIEAKSTSRKLLSINSKRVKTHRLKIGSKYTMIVTPNFAIGVLGDIEGEDSVIVKSATLANYFYQSVLQNGREISYAALDNIIESGYGIDITEKVNAFVYSRFGHGADDFHFKPS